MKKFLILPAVALLCAVSTGHAGECKFKVDAAYANYLGKRIALQEKILRVSKKLLSVQGEGQKLQEKIRKFNRLFRQLQNKQNAVVNVENNLSSQLNKMQKELTVLGLEGDKWALKNCARA